MPKPWGWAIVTILLTAAVPSGAAEAIPVVAAENFYGDIASQIGGAAVAVTSVLDSPDQDPHLFEASPSVARAIAGARVVVYNGLGYDPWIEKLLRTGPRPQRTVIEVGALVGRKNGDNPHVWYDPATMPAVARALAGALARIDPAGGADYRRRLMQFDESMRPLGARIAALRRRLAGMPAAATEPVFGDMLTALGMEVRNRRFMLAVMNNTEPSASDIAAFEDDLKARRVRLLVYNKQAADPTARRMVQVAEAAHIPVVAVTETEPPGTSYQAWIMSELEAVDRALPGSTR